MFAFAAEKELPKTESWGKLGSGKLGKAGVWPDY